MERDWDLAERTDGKTYLEQDLVKVGCGDCKGCSQCCQVVGDSIVLDPYDMWQFAKIGKSFEELLETSIELHVIDGMILPNLKIGDRGCSFLSKEGRCEIHSQRPGICRLFPLGRLYEKGDFSYILQIHECPKPGKTKVKVSKWLDIPNIIAYHSYIRDWHYFIKNLGERLKQEAAVTQKRGMMYVLLKFFQTPFVGEEDFYPQFESRLQEARNIFGEEIR